jgi:hypothetical protein
MLMMERTDEGRRLEDYLNDNIGKVVVSSDQLSCSPHKHLLEVRNIGIYQMIAKKFKITRLSDRKNNYVITVPNGRLQDHWTVFICEEYLPAFLEKFGDQYE